MKPVLKPLIFLLSAILLTACGDSTRSDLSQAPAPAEEGIEPRITLAGLANLDSLSIDFQMRENCMAISSDKNATPSRGEYQSSNKPHPVDATFPRNGFYLQIREDEWVTIDSNILGHRLYLVNTTNAPIELKASDSRLYIITEALDEKNEWKPITYLPSSWCGNSYHRVMLDTGEYWSFDVPVFKGSFKTKLRYTLLLGERETISSNEIVAYLNPGQFDPIRKEGHQAVNVMDPYSD